MKELVYRNLRAFSGVGCKGNMHRIIPDDGGLSSDEWLNYSSEVESEIVIALPSVESDMAQAMFTVKPRFFHRGHEVRFCGSGCMAVAYYVFEQNAEVKLKNKLSIILADKIVDMAQNKGRVSMSVNAALHAKNIRKTLLESLIKKEIVEAIELEDGYIIALLNNVKDLQHLQPKLTQMAKMGGPALIVTALGGTSVKEDYVMRYFAPQFGNPEDMATGSANVYLMKYWQLKLNKKRLCGKQMSSAGALFYGVVRGDKVILSGKVE